MKLVATEPAPKASRGKKAASAETARKQAELPLEVRDVNHAPGKTESAVRRSKEESVAMSEGASNAAQVQKKRGVVRIAAGERRPKLGASTAPEVPPPSPPAPPPIKTIRRAGGGRVELNPKLESSRGVISRPEPSSAKPMSVAEKKRAAAEAAFSKVAPSVVERVVSAPTPATNGAHGPAGAPPAPHKSTFEARISERDALSTTLRLAETRDAALAAARELATRFQLPPDQALLCKVISLGEPDLAKLALEELLELDDRGRVRRTPELKESLDKLESQDRETLELKDLLLEKIGAFSG